MTHERSLSARHERPRRVGAALGSCGFFVFRLAGWRAAGHNSMMKITDDYHGKIEIWARESRVARMPRISNLPAFRCRRFNSYQELNEWKQSLRDELLKRGGAQWTK